MDLNEKKGFTLIEILIVIAIISGFVVILFPNFMEFRIKSRDARRKSDLKQIQKALELYKMDINPPVYPDALPACGASLLSPDGSKDYMQKTPCDPQSPSTGQYKYTRDPADSLKYTLYSCLETKGDLEKVTCPVGITCSCGAACGCYKLTEP